MTHILVSDYLKGHSDPMVREAGRIFKELEMDYPANIVEERNILRGMLVKVAWNVKGAETLYPHLNEAEREVWSEILHSDAPNNALLDQMK